MKKKQLNAIYLFSLGCTVNEISNAMDESPFVIKQLLENHKYNSALDIPCFQISGIYLSAAELKELIQGATHALLTGRINNLVRSKRDVKDHAELTSWRHAFTRFAPLEKKSDEEWLKVVASRTSFKDHSPKVIAALTKSQANKPKPRRIHKELELRPYGIPKLARLA